MSETVVQRKTAKLIQQELSEILSFGKLAVPGVMLTLSVVRVTRDLGLAKVYVTAMPEDQLAGTVEYLNEQSWEVRHALSQRIRNKLRKMPELRFFVDDTFKEAERIEQLLAEAGVNQDEEE
ncbi:MAG: 30S ribosome-binding factor RbfA [Bacteroidota bacterium]